MESGKIKEAIEQFKSNKVGIHHYAVYLENYGISYIGMATEDELEEELKKAPEEKTYVNDGVIIIIHPTLDDMYVINSKSEADIFADTVYRALRSE